MLIKFIILCIFDIYILFSNLFQKIIICFSFNNQLKSVMKRKKLNMGNGVVGMFKVTSSNIEVNLFLFLRRGNGVNFIFKKYLCSFKPLFQ